jgi:hypothetical protein
MILILYGRPFAFIFRYIRMRPGLTPSRRQYWQRCLFCGRSVRRSYGVLYGRQPGQQVWIALPSCLLIAADNLLWRSPAGSQVSHSSASRATRGFYSGILPVVARYFADQLPGT